MKKCNNCGFDNEDSAKFCGTCGANLADMTQNADEVAQAEASQPVAANVCPACGATNDADAAFCVGCGGKLGAAANADATGTTSATEAKPQKGFKGKIIAVKDKTIAFEKKHSIILNAIVAVVALVVALVALFAPVKVMGYYDKTLGYGDYDDDGNVVGQYVAVDQSIFQMFGALGYISSDAKDVEKINKEYEKAMDAAKSEYMLWMMGNSGASDEEIMEKRAEIVADHLSDINYLGYILANTQEIDLSGLFGGNYNASYDYVTPGDGSSGSSSDKDTPINGDYYAAIVTVVFGVVIAAIAIALAIFSIVSLVFAIIGMVKKKPQDKLFKFFGKIMAISASGLAIMFCAPMLVAGGGMLAVSVFTAIMYFVCGIAAAFLRKDNWMVILKRSIMVVLSMIAFYLLCTNVFAYDTVYSDATQTTRVPTGYGLYSVFTVLETMFGEGSFFQPAGQAIAGFVLWVLIAGVVQGLLHNVLVRNLSLTAVGESKKSPKGAMIGASVVMLVAIIFGFISGTLANAFAGMFGEFEASDDLVMKVLMRAQVWVSMFLTIAGLVLMCAFKPENKTPAAQQPQEQQQPVVADPQV